MLPDLLNFIDENGLKIMLDLKGWTYNSSALIINNLAVVKPDFYPDRHVLARGKKGYIYASGETRISYAGREFNSVGDLLAECGETVMNDYKDWVLINYPKEQHTGVKNESSPQLQNTIRYNSAYEVC